MVKKSQLPLRALSWHLRRRLGLVLRERPMQSHLHWENFVILFLLVVFSDHNPLLYLRECAPKSAKITRWASGLQEFDLSWQYRPGSKNQVADCLSRLWWDGQVTIRGRGLADYPSSCLAEILCCYSQSLCLWCKYMLRCYDATMLQRYRATTSDGVLTVYFWRFTSVITRNHQSHHHHHHHFIYSIHIMQWK